VHRSTRGVALVLLASIGTACGLSITGEAPPADVGDAGLPVHGTDAGALPDGETLAEGESDSGAAAKDAGTGWCATQAAHQLCVDFDDGTLGGLTIQKSGAGNCVVASSMLTCTTASGSKSGYALLKKWAPKPKTIDLAFDVTVAVTGYSQLGGFSTDNGYYEMLISTYGGTLDYIEYPAGGFEKVLSTQGTGVHHVHQHVDFTTNHITVTEGATTYDGNLQAPPASTSAQALVGIYDTDRDRTVTIDNVTLDWTQ